MARKPSKNLTQRELEIMQVLWALDEAPLGEVQEGLRRAGTPVAPSTVATQLTILMHKGFVTQTGRPGRSLYAPTCSKEEATRNLLDDFLARIGLHGSPRFLIQLLKAEKLSAEDREALETILREQEPPRRSRSRPPEPPTNKESTP